MSLIQHHQANSVGRDFAVGDIHGCFDLLRAELAKVNFDEDKDRLFSVGDLVDRGPSSIDAVEWIGKPWFHAVRGNHEQMAIGVASGRHNLENYCANGGEWFIQLSQEQREAISAVFECLPVAMDVETADGLVGFIHADTPFEWPSLLSQLEEAGDLSKTKLRALLNYCLWSRDRIKESYDADVPGLWRLFVGHTPVRQPTALGNVLYIDTGAVYGNGLTLIQFAGYGA